MSKLAVKNRENPFKFGSVVNGVHFTNRVNEIQQVKSVLNSVNHLVLIAPRRFGKTSLIKKTLEGNKCKSIFINMQTINTIEGLAAKLLKKTYDIFTIESLKNKIKSFRIIPDVSINPITQEVSVSFNPQGQNKIHLLEDVLNMLNSFALKNNRIVCVLDEFQEIERIDKNLSRQLRSIMQNHSGINYIFLGSQESMMKYIFEDKKSPFYHFGSLMNLEPISKNDFFNYIKQGFYTTGTKIEEAQITEMLLFTYCHPYYTQQLAFNVWNNVQLYDQSNDMVENTINQIVQIHDYDYERLWQNLNNTDRKIIAGLNNFDSKPLSSEFGKKTGVNSSSTVLSSIKRLVEKGYLIYSGNTYQIEDPYFKLWIKKFMQQ